MQTFSISTDLIVELLSKLNGIKSLGSIHIISCNFVNNFVQAEIQPCERYSYTKFLNLPQNLKSIPVVSNMGHGPTSGPREKLRGPWENLLAIWKLKCIYQKKDCNFWPQ